MPSRDEVRFPTLRLCRLVCVPAVAAFPQRRPLTDYSYWGSPSHSQIRPSQPEAPGLRSGHLLKIFTPPAGDIELNPAPRHALEVPLQDLLRTSQKQSTRRAVRCLRLLAPCKMHRPVVRGIRRATALRQPLVLQ